MEYLSAEMIDMLIFYAFILIGIPLAVVLSFYLLMGILYLILLTICFITGE